MEVNIVVASVAVVVSDRVVVAASVVDDGAIVEDGGEVVVEVNIVVSSVARWFQTELWLLHQLLDGAIVEMVERSCGSHSCCSTVAVVVSDRVVVAASLLMRCYS